MAGCRTSRAAVLSLVALTWCIFSAAARGDIIYSNDFQGPVGGEWSNTATATSPSGRTFLGQFGNGSVTLTLSGLGAHTDINLSFDLYLLGTWSGIHPSFGGPDSITVQADGTPLLSSSFTNKSSPAFQQNYPDQLGGATHPGFTGAAEVNTLGYNPDSVYHLDLALEHSASTLSITFTGNFKPPFGVDKNSIKTWGLDNVVVESLNGQVAEVLPEPGSLLLGLFGAAGVLVAARRRVAR